MKDTYNLLADGIVKLMRALVDLEQTSVKEWAKAQGYGRYTGSSIKGEVGIDWSDRRARETLLAAIVADTTGCWSCPGKLRGRCRRAAMSGRR